MMVPVSLEVRGRAVLVVGAGDVAARKAAVFLEEGARLTFVAPNAGPKIAAWAQAGEVVWNARGFEEHDVDGAFVVIAATEDAAVNDAAAAAGRAAGALICVSGAGRGQTSDFGLAASFRDGPVTISVSSGVPALSKALRDHLAGSIEPGFVRGATLLRAARTELNRVVRASERAATWRDLVQALPAACDSRESARKWLGARVGESQVEPLLELVDWDTSGNA